MEDERNKLTAEEEKARMRSLILALAGFITAAAVIAAVLFACARAGILRESGERTSNTSETAFSEPPEPEEIFKFEPIDEGSEAVLSVINSEFRKVDDGSAYVRLIAMNQGNTVIKVRKASCILYDRKGRCVGQYILSEDYILYSTLVSYGDGIGELSTSARIDVPQETADAKFYIEWEDYKGRCANMIVSPSSGRDDIAPSSAVPVMHKPHSEHFAG